MIKVFFVFSEDNNSFGVNQVGSFLNQELKKYCLINNNFSTLEFIKTKKNILHIHGCWSFKIFFYFIIAKIFGKKIILSPHGMLDPYSFTQKIFKKKMAWLLFQKYIVDNSNIIIVNSNLEKKNVKRLVKNKKVYTIPHGINKVDFLKKKIFNKKPRFVFFSRIHPVKNLKKLVEIWCNNKFFDNKILHIYGDISDKNYFYQINKKILNKKNILYKGALYKNKTLTLSKYDVFLFPSISENFGLVILEALSAGLYLIINHTLPWKKLEKKNFATISNFKTNNLINAIKSSGRNIRSKNRKKKIIRFLNENYSWNKISKSYFNIYKKVKT